MCVAVVMHKDKEDGLHHEAQFRNRDLTTYDHTLLDGEMFLQVCAVTPCHIRYFSALRSYRSFLPPHRISVIYHSVSLFLSLSCFDVLPWRWRQYNVPKRLILSKLHSITTKKTPSWEPRIQKHFFICRSVIVHVTDFRNEFSYVCLLRPLILEHHIKRLSYVHQLILSVTKN
jgi:hypothetical protein